MPILFLSDGWYFEQNHILICAALCIHFDWFSSIYLVMWYVNQEKCEHEKCGSFFKIKTWFTFAWRRLAYPIFNVNTTSHLRRCISRIANWKLLISPKSLPDSMTSSTADNNKMFLFIFAFRCGRLSVEIYFVVDAFWKMREQHDHRNPLARIKY